MKLKRGLSFIMIILIIFTVLPFGCSSSEEDLKDYTVEELKEFDGLEGRPAYVGYKGKVYDVTGLENWPDGGHFDLHMAGFDLTEFMADAPHAEDALFDNAELVGNLID